MPAKSRKQFFFFSDRRNHPEFQFTASFLTKQSIWHFPIKGTQILAINWNLITFELCCDKTWWSALTGFGSCILHKKRTRFDILIVYGSKMPGPDSGRTDQNAQMCRPIWFHWDAYSCDVDHLSLEPTWWKSFRLDKWTLPLPVWPRKQVFLSQYGNNYYSLWME